jgi:bacteriorhodopsin
LAAHPDVDKVAFTGLTEVGKLIVQNDQSQMTSYKIMIFIWHWIGVIGMSLGAIGFGVGAHNARNQRWQILYALNFFACAIAAGFYLTMALGQGVDFINGRPTYWVRYLSWFISTPLLLLILTYIGKTSLPITASLLGANAYTIATGFVAAISPYPINYIWYLVGCIAYSATAYLLLTQYRQQAEQNFPRVIQVLRRLLIVYLTIWTLYPLVWILSPTGFGVFDLGLETMFFTLLDLAAKIGFGFLSLQTLRTIERARQQAKKSSSLVVFR